MLRHPVRNFSLNRFGIWVDTRWSQFEHWTRQNVKQYTAVNYSSKFLNNSFVLNLLARFDKNTMNQQRNQPRSTENAILLHYNDQAEKHLTGLRNTEFIYPGLFLVAHNWQTFFGFAFGAYFHQHMLISAGRLVVTRMELIPHLESILFHKVGTFGLMRQELVPIKNLVKINALNSRHQYSMGYFPLVNLDMVFKDVETGEEYAFNAAGVWVEENLKHELISQEKRVI